MQSFNWVDIDGIRYRWDGQDNIVCTGRFGYQVTMSGNNISALELEGEEGEIAGTLNVDFAASTISFTPMSDASVPNLMVLVGHELGQQEYSLQSLSDASLQDLLSHADDFDWSSLMMAAAPEPLSAPQGHVLSWDSFHFEEDALLGTREPASSVSRHGSPLDSEISINIDLTNQVLEHIPPLHDI